MVYIAETIVTYGKDEGKWERVGCCWYLSRGMKAKLVSVVCLSHVCVYLVVQFPCTKSPVKGFIPPASLERSGVTTFALRIMWKIF